MTDFRDKFPARRLDPGYRARTYVDRQNGMPEPAEDRRRERALRREPHAPATPAIVTVTGAVDADATEGRNFYRLRGGSGVADRIMARVKNAANAIEVLEVAWKSYVDAALAGKSAVGHTHTNVMTVRSNSVSVASGTITSVTQGCFGGEKCSGGACSQAGGVGVQFQFAIGTDSSYTCAFYNGTAGNVTITTYAHCLAQTI
jgi:hypothetical protein